MTTVMGDATLLCSAVKQFSCGTAALGRPLPVTCSQRWSATSLKRLAVKLLWISAHGRRRELAAALVTSHLSIECLAGLDAAQ